MMSKKLNDRIYIAENKINKAQNKLNEDLTNITMLQKQIKDGIFHINNIKNNINKPCDTYSNDKNKCLLRNTLDIIPEDKCYFIQSKTGKKNYCANHIEQKSYINTQCNKINDVRLNNICKKEYKIYEK
jgi:hypothetical protein